jgi:hypothetical protein
LVLRVLRLPGVLGVLGVRGWARVLLLLCHGGTRWGI